MLHVPYKGSGAAINDLLGGHIDLSLPAVQPIAPYAEAGKVKLLAVTGEARDPLVPNVPTMKEAGLPGATVVIVFGLLGPAGMPANVVDRLRKESVAALNSPETKKKFKAAGFDTDPLAGDEFEKSVSAEYKLWRDLAASEHIVLDDSSMCLMRPVHSLQPSRAADTLESAYSLDPDMVLLGGLHLGGGL